MRFKLTLTIFFFIAPLFAEAQQPLTEQTIIENTHTTQARLELASGNFKKAHQSVLKAIEDDKQHYGLKHKKTAINLTLLATILFNLGQNTNANVFFLQSQNLAAQLSNTDNLLSTNNLFGLANIDKRQGRYDKALISHKKILNLRQADINSTEPDVIYSLLEIAQLQIILARYDKAQLTLSQTARLIRNINDQAIYARFLNQKGLLAVAIKNYAAAKEFYKQALDIQLATFTGTNTLVANTLINIANRLNTIGNPDMAIPLYREAAVIYTNELSASNLKLASTMNNMAMAYLKTGKNDNAMRLNKKAYEIAKKIINDKHPFFAFNLINKANSLIAKKQYKTARSLYVKARNILETAYGSNHPKVAIAIENIANLLQMKE